LTKRGYHQPPETSESDEEPEGGRTVGPII